MSTTDVHPPAAMHRDSGVAGWFSKAEAWLDERGKGAWIAAMVLGFIFVWPVGLALLSSMLWRKRMFSGNSTPSRHSRRHARHSMRTAMKSSGNSAFDAYKSETLRRLEDEQQNFEEFLERLREAKDKAEFDEFMKDRARAAQADAESEQSGPAPA